MTVSEDQTMSTDMVRRLSKDARKSLLAAHELERKSRFQLCPCYIPKRLVMVVLCFLGMFVIHAMRVNVAVAVVTLIDETVHVKVGTPKAVSNILRLQEKWDARMIGFLHSIFYVGFLITQIPGGCLVNKIPSHRLFGASILFSCALNLLVPIAIADVGFAFTCVVRFTQGLSEGLTFPACYKLLAMWTLGPELSKMASFVVTGVYAGAIFGFPISGFLTHYVGWQHVFYLNGGLGILWFLFWIYLAFERPEYHPYISRKELEFILCNQEDGEQEEGEEYTVPWRDIFRSVPVITLCLCHFSRSWMFFLLLTNEPAYINTFGFTIAANGILSSIPHIAMVVISACSGPLADYLIRTPSLNTTQVRKIFTCVGFGMESLACFVLTFVNSGHLAMVALSVGVGFSGLTTSGWQINHLDIAPRFAGILIGITTAVGTVGGIISPLIVGVITYRQTLHSWQMAWLLTSGVLMFGVIFYAIFASGEKQAWASPSSKGHSKGDVINTDNDNKSKNSSATETADSNEEKTLPKNEAEPLNDGNNATYGTNDDTR